MRTDLEVRETAADPDGRKHFREVVGRGMNFLAGARAVGPTVEEQPGQGQHCCE